MQLLGGCGVIAMAGSIPAVAQVLKYIENE